MLWKSALITSASGSLGGMTFSHNKGGQYTRARTIPTNPNSSYQQAVRGFMSQLTSLWQSGLSVAQRAAWTVYAENVELIGPLGDPRTVTGLNMYVRSNVPRLQAGLARVDAGPTTYDLGDYTNPALSGITAATDEYDIEFDDGDDWVGETGAAMLVYSGRQVSPAITYFKGPYRYADLIAGDATTPPTSPATISSPFALDVGNYLYARAQVTRADGRLSAPFRLSGIIAS